MKSIITIEIMDEVWEKGHRRVLELVKLKGEYPTLTKKLDRLRELYIICLNSVTTRDYNRIEKTRTIINETEKELENLMKEIDTDNRRIAKAKKIAEEIESEEK